MNIHGVHVRPGDIIARRPDDKKLWWLVLGGDDNVIILAYASPHHMEIQQQKCLVLAHQADYLDPLVKVNWR